MMTEIVKPGKGELKKAKIYIIDIEKEYSNLSDEKEFLDHEIDRKSTLCYLRAKNEITIYALIHAREDANERLEKSRIVASEAYALLKSNDFREVSLISNNESLESAFLEGLVLSSYQFDKFKTEKEKYQLAKVYSEIANDNTAKLLAAVSWSRDLVNEPPAHQTAVALSKEFEKMAKEIDGLDVQVFNKTQIESLRMGGLLSINRGSVQPPTFSVMTWKPENAINEKPIVFVGKGVVYDTGGINLKPTGYLETMKSDMAGSAVVAGLIRAVASTKLPLYVIALVPATDNRPGGDAIVPSDIVTMMGGQTVEIINTDAEGRMILADGLSYSEKYDPELVFSIATLTGAAAMAFGSKAFVSMGNDGESLSKLHTASLQSGERCWELPFWSDYGDELKSTIADLKHMGGKSAGAITAGKFLENFVSKPYIHLDIAGVSFTEKKEDYKPIGGTGTGIRAIYQFLNNYISEKS